MPLSGFSETTFVHEGVTYPVFRRGAGPGVVIIHEVPGITPQVAGFGRRVAEAGFTVVLPSLFGTPGKPFSLPYVGQQFIRACISREFHVLREETGRVVTLNKLHTCPHSILRTLLRWEGLEEDQVRLATLVQGEAMVEAIRRGETAAAVLWEPYVSYVERVLGWKVLAEGRTVMTPSNYGILLHARRSLLAEQPELVQRLLTAYAASVRAAQQDRAAAAAVLQQCMPHTPPEDIERSGQREARYWSADTSLDFRLLDRVVQELGEQTVIPPEFVLSEVLAEVRLAA